MSARRVEPRAGTRVGVDLAEVAQVAEAIERHGRHYTERLYTSGELADATGAPEVRARHLAARFAAKEAVLKILRCGADGAAWTEIEIVRGAGGEPRIALTGRAARLAHDAGLTGWDVSLSHEGPLAVAVVVAEARPDATRPEPTRPDPSEDA